MRFSALVRAPAPELAGPQHRPVWPLTASSPLLWRTRDVVLDAAFIAFTGTPVSLTGRNFKAVFGRYISIYVGQLPGQAGAVRQIVNSSLISDEGIDVFSAAGPLSFGSDRCRFRLAVAVAALVVAVDRAPSPICTVVVRLRNQIDPCRVRAGADRLRLEACSLMAQPSAPADQPFAPADQASPAVPELPQRPADRQGT